MIMHPFLVFGIFAFAVCWLVMAIVIFLPPATSGLPDCRIFLCEPYNIPPAKRVVLE